MRVARLGHVQILTAAEQLADIEGVLLGGQLGLAGEDAATARLLLLLLVRPRLLRLASCGLLHGQELLLLALFLGLHRCLLLDQILRLRSQFLLTLVFKWLLLRLLLRRLLTTPMEEHRIIVLLLQL